MGANYPGSGTASYTYTASNTHEYTLTGTNSLTLGLLTIGAYNGGFSSLRFTVAEGSTTLLSKSFTTLSAAQTYFTDDPLSLGNITGAVDLKLTFKLTASTSQGAGISYLLADAPVSSGVRGLAPESTAAVAVDTARIGGPRDALWIEPRRGAAVSPALWTFDSASSAVGAAARPLLRIPQRLAAAAPVKGLRR